MPMQHGYRRLAVHPRVCGERASKTCAAKRGCRFIPACAGNALRREALALPDAGSSPRVRGTLGQQCAAKLGRRFIPACAGNAMFGAKKNTW